MFFASFGSSVCEKEMLSAYEFGRESQVGISDAGDEKVEMACLGSGRESKAGSYGQT